MISLTSPYKTRAHDWPAGVKLAMLFVATLVLFALDSLVFASLVFIAAMLLYRLPGKGFFREGIRHLRIVLPFVVIVLIWHMLTDDLAAGLRITLRMATAVALANLVTMTTTLSELTELLHWLCTPLRRLGIQTGVLETGIALLIRFIPVLIERAKLLFQSWRARSERRPNWRIIMPMFLMALDDAEQVGEALRARGGIRKDEGK